MTSALKAMSSALDTQTAAFEKLRGEMECLKQRFLPKRKTESMCPPKAELDKRNGRPKDPKQAKKTRAARKQKRSRCSRAKSDCE
ncbi:MAG: hypothetical protein AAFZ18_36340 [Myxococcota bacterium]